MSSILDALNKLEDEREFAREQENLKSEDVDAHEAAEEMIGRDVLRDTFAMRVNPVMLIGGGLLFILVLVVVVAVSVALALRPDSPAVETVASVPLLPAADTVSAVPEPELPTTPVVESAPEAAGAGVNQEEQAEAVESEAVLETETLVVDEPGEPMVAAPEIVETVEAVEESPVETPVAPAPDVKESIVVVKADPAPLPLVVEEIAEAAPVAREPELIAKVPEQTPLQAEINVMTLPIFSEDLQHKFGLDDMTINMVNPESVRNQYGSAVINHKKVYEKAYILESQVRLLKVVDDGIAVEVSRTGGRYFMEY